ncbi:ATP-dependent DNA helicase RecG [Weeksella virosa]|nr:ATP-dependent DNA helicase RecG [Weeksella virosa]MDK7375519.1 ATP-dependent DNA helicase RecG [Weeksella virosa]MDK7674608.1 ATP-dependent DNA helicase RecG [Weeksella virosa]VEH63919.1 ATP-dependent DNA helicase recG [Weeksella virosa]
MDSFLFRKLVAEKNPMYSSKIKTPIEYLKGVGPERAKLLQKELQIFRYEDLLNHFPFRYVDRSRFYKIKELVPTMAEVQLIGKMVSLETITSGKKKRLVAKFIDDTGQMELVWFKFTKWQVEKFQKELHQPILIYGKPNLFNSVFSMVHPEIEDAENAKTMPLGLFPVYPSTELLAKKGITNRMMQKIILQLFQESIMIEENLSTSLVDQLKLISRAKAYAQIHFPKNAEELRQAEFRLKFEELFFFQLSMFVKKIGHQQTNKSQAFPRVGEYFNTFYNNYIPFELTNAQKRVVKEIYRDLRQHKQMNRLLQGDVGSGKTMVALLSMLLAIDNNFQATLIAPTEILAQQHYQSVVEYLGDLDVKVALITGSTTKSQRQPIHEGLLSGEINILIGTHAILEDTVQFNNLGLAIIDEQHRFGVAQRAKFWRKAKQPPHILVMTATPIPRTLAMSLYGDLDISVIDELPKGRKPIQTIHKTDAHRLQLFHFLKKEIDKGRQVYIVYPLIEESKKLELKDLMDGYESITREFPLPKYAVGIVHGRQKPAEKDYEMQRFIKGETHILVATTVIEVGVNVPNASVMVIENAERFGLSQLHQLRGRVGRGAEQSYCILMTHGQLNETSYQRISTMCQTNDGFQIAEVDLQLRGPGDLMGTQQSGVLDFKLASLTKDRQLIEWSRQAADRLLKEDPRLEKSENLPIKKYFLAHHKDKIAWSQIS